LFREAVDSFRRLSRILACAPSKTTVFERRRLPFLSRPMIPDKEPAIQAARMALQKFANI